MRGIIGLRRCGELGASISEDSFQQLLDLPSSSKDMKQGAGEN